MALTGKELDDSIFGTESHLDWADEVNMEPLHDDPFLHSTEKHDEGVGSMDTSPKSYNSGRKSKEAREPRGRSQQQQERQPRQGGRGQRGSVDGAYGGSARGDQGGVRSGSRGGPRSRAGRSGSRQGGSSQQGHAQQLSTGGGGGRQGRGPRDRSTSMERTGGTERPRNWRGSTSRARADKTDRWEHDKFDAAPVQSTRNSRGRRNSSGNYGTSPAAAVDIEQIGKEGISHVTINRRGSNASSRGHLPASFEQPRQLSGSMDSHGDAGDSIGHARRKSRSGPYANSVGQLLSPRSPPLVVGGTEPYRAPHRRQSSADGHPPPPPAAASVPEPATAPAAEPAPAPAPTQPPAPAAGPQVNAAINEEDEGSSAELEWENFVANGGLDIPFESITDELLKQPCRPLTQTKGSHQNKSNTPSKGNHQRTQSGKTHDRTELLLNDDNDDTDDFSESTGASDAHAGGGRRQSRQSEQGISIRGLAKKAAAAAATKSSTARADAGTASLGRDKAVPRAVQPTKTPSKQQTAKGPSAPSKDLKAAPAAVNGHKPADKTPVQPTRPAPSSRSRSTTPTKPATPTRSLSRASSSEGSPRASGSVPSSYMRRQYEVYDEDRGRHVFSVNIPYDEHRFAPIHVHERDDVAKLAAKFARIWRVHNKEQRIKRMLSKMKAVMQEESL
ncbi:hypothetical protein GGF43_000214 [Coemansia sp. RSA 2618]|nr:hypothetical protein GGF43_000214 [Coemansia sp. RSA 2618]